MNTPVATEDWLTDSKAANELLDPTDYSHKALVKTGKIDRSMIFSRMHLFFTHSAVSNYKDGWSDIQKVAKAAGALEVEKIPPNKPDFFKTRGDETIVFGSEEGDVEVSRLIKERGRKVYSKELFTHSIISGELDLEDDAYQLTAAPRTKKGRRS